MPKEDLGLGKSDLKRPMDRTAMSNDSAALRQLVGFLNNPAITGAAQPPKEEVYDAPSGSTGATLIAPTVPQENPASPGKPEPVLHPEPAAPAKSQSIGLRLLVTGRDAARVINAIGSESFNLLGAAARLQRYFYPDASPGDAGMEEFISNVRAWGTSELTAAHPASVQRACFTTMIQSLGASGFLGSEIDWTKYGRDAGFWVDTATRLSKEFENIHPGMRLALTGVSNKIEYDYFRALGFVHWHVFSRPGTAGSSTPLDIALDNDVVKQLSAKRNGPKLRAIWCESTAPPSPRLWTLQEFVSTAGAAESVAGISVE